MTQTSKRDLTLYVGCQEDCTHTWALDPPPGRNSFRIVVHCRRAQNGASPKPRSWSSYFDAIAQEPIAAWAGIGTDSADDEDNTQRRREIYQLLEP